MFFGHIEISGFLIKNSIFREKWLTKPYFVIYYTKMGCI